MMRALRYATASDGVRLAWREDGPPEAPPVLLCTMGGGALSMWDAAVEGLGERWRIIRYDRRGDGESDAGEPATHTLSTHLADALAVLDAAECPSASVCGMAFGARIATHLALYAPERVGKLILFDATAGPPAPEAERRRRSLEAAALHKAAGLKAASFDRRWFERRDPNGAGGGGRALAGHPDWTPGLDRIQVATFIATGKQDPNLEGSRRMAREIPGAVFELMPMTGHASWLDRPDLVLQLLRKFLSH